MATSTTVGSFLGALNNWLRSETSAGSNESTVISWDFRETWASDHCQVSRNWLNCSLSGLPSRENIIRSRIIDSLISMWSMRSGWTLTDDSSGGWIPRHSPLVAIVTKHLLILWLLIIKCYLGSFWIFRGQWLPLRLILGLERHLSNILLIEALIG